MAISLRAPSLPILSQPKGITIRPSPEPTSSGCARWPPTATSASASLFHRTDHRAKAAEHLTTAAGMYREMDMGFWLEKAEGELGSPHKILT